MDYIINPTWFYWISVCDSLKGIFLVISIIAFVLIIIYMNEESNLCRKYLKCSIIVMILAAFGTVFTPNESTLQKMLRASTVTKSNIELSKNELKNLIEYIGDESTDFQERTKN